MRTANRWRGPSGQLRLQMQITNTRLLPGRGRSQRFSSLFSNMMTRKEMRSMYNTRYRWRWPCTGWSSSSTPLVLICKIEMYCQNCGIWIRTGTMLSGCSQWGIIYPSNIIFCQIIFNISQVKGTTQCFQPRCPGGAPKEYLRVGQQGILENDDFQHTPWISQCRVKLIQMRVGPYPR